MKRGGNEYDSIRILYKTIIFFERTIHGIGGGIQASEALQIKIQASCAHNCQVGELYAPTFDHGSFTLLYFVLTFDLSMLY